MKSEEQPASFDESYFRTAYRDYQRQNPTRKLAFYESIVAKALDTRPATLVDLGCGLGAFLGYLRSRDPNKESLRLIGTDVSEFAVNRNQREIPDVEFFVRPIEAAPLPGVSADIVTAFDVLEHLESPDSAAKAIHAVLRHGGLFVFVVPVYDGPLGPLVIIADQDSTHVQRHARTWWLEWTARFFTVIEWQGIYRGMTPMGMYIHHPSQLLRRWAPAIVVAATPA